MEIRKNILVCLLSVRNTISLSRLEENKILELRNSEFLMKLTFPSSVTGEFPSYVTQKFYFH